MGEARRRKLLDPNYGKSALDLRIKASENTQDYIVFCGHCGFYFDTAAEYHDALLVKEAIQQILSTNPVRRYECVDWYEWLKKHLDTLPRVKSRFYFYGTPQKKPFIEGWVKRLFLIRSGVDLDYSFDNNKNIDSLVEAEGVKFAIVTQHTLLSPPNQTSGSRNHQ